ncbi:hypothetical protein [Mycoplasmopsis cynos]|uniref:hypothetical protein n=1 Tax=Mycoplasmopsis cynos TaxID=171284 RepID=UPI00220EA15B|nr:hypothetical protein [Mycoplasmopsis cynos]UWV81256.1 hypothetical protein NW065_04790 [Mycoplasmopsis cynos]
MILNEILLSKPIKPRFKLTFDVLSFILSTFIPSSSTNSTLLDRFKIPKSPVLSNNFSSFVFPLKSYLKYCSWWLCNLILCPGLIPGACPSLLTILFL